MPEVASAEQALRDQLPEVALTKLERLLATPKLPDEVLQAAHLLVVESAVRAGKPARGLELTESAALPHSPGLVFWRAAALQALGQYRAALSLLEELPGDTAEPLLGRAKFNRASLLLGLGDVSEAIKVLQELEQSGDAATVQRGRLWLAEAQLQLQDLPAAQATLNRVESGEADVQKIFLLGKLEFAQGHGAAAAQWFGQVVTATEAAARPLHLPALLGAGAESTDAGGRRELRPGLWRS